MTIFVSGLKLNLNLTLSPGDPRLLNPGLSSYQCHLFSRRIIWNVKQKLVWFTNQEQRRLLGCVSSCMTEKIFPSATPLNAKGNVASIVCNHWKFLGDIIHSCVCQVFDSYVRSLNYTLLAIAKLPNNELTGIHTLSLPPLLLWPLMSIPLYFLSINNRQ